MVESAGTRVDDPFAARGRYRVIYADPPWVYRDRAESGRRGVAFKYSLLDDADIAALPVAKIAADDAMLFLWVTWPKMPEVLPVIEAWGFHYRTVGFVWVKRTRRSGALAWGMGSWTRANTEPCLLATRGRPKRVSASVHQVVEAPATQHSQKPGEVRERIVQLAGDVRRIELFARDSAPGWDAWGNELRCEGSLAHGTADPRALPRLGSAEWHAQRERLVAYIEEHGPSTRRQIVAALDVRSDLTKALLTRLVADGTLAKVGRTRGTRYQLGRGDTRAEGDRGPLPGELVLMPPDR